MLSVIFEKIGFPPESEWPAISFLKRSSFRAPGQVRSLRNAIRTDDSTALNLIEQMIQFNPKKRITAAEALALPYFHPRPNTFPGLPFQSQNVCNSSTASGTVLRSTGTLRPHRHSDFPNQSIKSYVSAAGAAANCHTLVNNLSKPVQVGSGWSGYPSGPLCNPRMTGTFVGNQTQQRIKKSASSSSGRLNNMSTVGSDRDQQNVLMSVVNHAIDDPLPPPSLLVSSSPPRRPVTRQQAKANRRYTQPTTSVNSTRAVFAHTDYAGKKLISSGVVPTTAHSSYVHIAPKPAQLSAPNPMVLPVSASRGGRQRRTARRRTVIGTANRTTKPATVPTCTSEGLQVSRTDSQQKVNGITVNQEISSHKSDETSHYADSTSNQCQQQYHQRLIKILNRQQQHRYPPLYELQQPCDLGRPSRYSLGPTWPPTTLVPISENQRNSDYHYISSDKHDESTENTLIQSEFSSAEYNDEPEGLRSSTAICDSAILCSPSKLARVTPPQPTKPYLLSQTSSFSEEPTSALDMLSEKSSTTLDDAGNETEDSDYQPANTSLGINSAMTGLALVNRTHSTSLQSMLSDTIGPDASR
ncbi:unnamed protein product [Calicophoron daubneyi]